jgi:hypothetical protein
VWLNLDVLRELGLTKVSGLTRTHSLRYVLKNRETNKELFVVNISLLPTEQVEKEGGAEEKKTPAEEVHAGNDEDELD